MTGATVQTDHKRDESADVIFDHLVGIEEYLRFEETSPIRHEFVDGVLCALVGSSLRHSEIVGSIYTAIRPQARHSHCHVYFVQVKLQVSASCIYYPDVMVVCDPDDQDPLIASMPCLVVEVLSPSTESTDRREKSSAYRALASLRSYLIVYQDEIRAEHYYRDAMDAWNQEFVTEGAVTLRCPPMELQLADIYDQLPATD